MEEKKELFILDETRRLMFPGSLFQKEIDVIRDVGLWNKLSKPAIKKTMDWEAWGPGGFMSLRRDEAAGDWKLWYSCPGTDNDIKKSVCGMAYSIDGLNWNKHGEPVGTYGHGLAGSVVIKSDSELGEKRIFMMKAVNHDTGPCGALLGTSSDGINFEPVFETWEKSVLAGPCGNIDLLWDEGFFRAYFQQWRVNGISDNKDEIDCLFKDIEKAFVDKAEQKFHISGETAWPEEKHVDLSFDVSDIENIKKDGKLEYPVCKDFCMKKAISLAVSRDFLNWEYRGPAITNKDNETGFELVGMPVVKYENQYVGMPLMYYRDTGRVATGFAYSEDGDSFKLLTEKPLIDTENHGSWDSGVAAGFGDLLQVDDRLSLYFGAAVETMKEMEKGTGTFSIGRAWNRLDGFCALKRGTVITRPLVMKNGILHINAEGIIKIKIDDLDGYTITDFEWGGNRMDLAICHPQLHANRPYLIEFTVKEGALYSFWSGESCISS